MIDEICRYYASADDKYRFSILIPTWNNFPYLQLCISSLRKHSKTALQIIVFVNEGKDGTVEWLKKQGDIDFIYAEKNVGICYGMNLCRSMIKAEYVLYLNDDMYVLPDWDKILSDEIDRLGTKLFMLSATMIEPHKTGNVCVVVKDFGDTLECFNEQALTGEFHHLTKDDWNGSTWPPNVIHIDMWDLVGGFSVEFSPGMYSDPDLSKKMYDAGVRIFKGMGRSMVYHFGSKSTKRVRKNRGRNQFLMKWGMSSKFFTWYILNKGLPYAELPAKKKLSFLSLISNKIKILKLQLTAMKHREL